SIKKKMGNAVKRNYEKRIIREVFRQNKSLLPNLNVLIMKIGNAKTGFRNKESELLELFRKLM
ncbi:MAG: ribonuclease P protein component, partial [Spirochaetota bacterium]|nr:ribonuclease P protein component [Spirochaetota bacterium]